MIVGVLAIGLAGAADGVEGASAFTSQSDEYPANSGLERKQSGDPYFAPDERADLPSTAGYTGDPPSGLMIPACGCSRDVDSVFCSFGCDIGVVGADADYEDCGRRR